MQQRLKEKRKLQEAVKQHKKGVKDQLDEVLSHKKKPDKMGTKK